MRRSLVLAGLTLAVTSVLAQVPASELAKPPAEARHFPIQSTGGKHGDSWMWVAPDGARMGRESMNLRGQVFELDSAARAGADGLPSSVAIRGVTPQGDAAETFSVANGTASWKSPVDEGKAAYSAPAFPLSRAPMGSASRSCASSRSTWKRGSAQLRRSRRRRSFRRGWCTRTGRQVR